MTAIAAAKQIVVDAVAARIFPGATVEVGSSRGPIWQDAMGMLSFDAATAIAIDAIFDLSSLTKPVATATVIMQLVHEGTVRLEEPVAGSFAEWRGADRDAVNVRDLLEHASGLAARLVDPAPPGRREFEHDICTMPLEYPPRSQSIYSDLGFILLGLLASDRAGRALADTFTAIVADMRLLAAGHTLTFDVPPESRGRVAPTTPLDNDARRGRTLVGEVQDPYAAVLGGLAGHAGLFGDAPALGAFSRVALKAVHGDSSLPAPFTPALVAQFTTRSTVPKSSRALGWDTMLPTSSCGTRMSARAFGHVGFTGTSLWIDPDRDRYFVLLTNRAHRGGSLDQMRTVRRAFHDALADV